MKDEFLKMFHFLLKRNYESKPINKGYRDVNMSFTPDKQGCEWVWFSSPRII